MAMADTRFFAHDPAAGSRFFCDTREAAREYVEESIKANRKAAVHDGEWPPEAEDVVMGIAVMCGSDEDGHQYTITHRCKLKGNTAKGFECYLTAVTRPQGRNKTEVKRT